MRLWALILVLVLGFTSTSCATIPPEAVELSRTLGQMISRAKAAHIVLVDQHFDNLALQVDKFAMGEYKTAFLENVRKIMKQRDPSFVALTPEQYDAAINRVLQNRSKWLQSVWANKYTVLKSLEDYYATMEQANAEITNLIRSAAGTESVRNRLVTDFTSQFNMTSKDLENKLMGSVTDVNSMLNGALQKILE